MSFSDNVKNLAERIAAEFRAYLPLSGGKVDGDLEVTGSLKATATYATHDANGNVIADTYAEKSAITGFASTSHASSGTGHGIGTSTQYGHNRLSDAVDSSSDAEEGVAATPFAVKTAYDHATAAAETAEDAQLAADEAVVSISVSGSALVLTKNDGSTTSVETGFGQASEQAEVSAGELTLATPISAGTTLSVPRYFVGANTLCIWVDGARALRGSLFSEVGAEGTVSTTVLINDDISAEHEVTATSEIAVSGSSSATGSASITEAEIATPVTSSQNVTVPTYIVGSNAINIYVDGVLCQRGSDFVEVGSAGAESTTIQFTSDISSEYDIIVVVG